LALSKGPIGEGVSFSTEGGNSSSFRNILFSKILFRTPDDGKSTESQQSKMLYIQNLHVLAGFPVILLMADIKQFSDHLSKDSYSVSKNALYQN
jgi:hypothetical protein